MYIGNTVQNQGFVPAIDYFSGNASTTAFTLSRPVASTYQMIVNVANVDQNPGSAYTVSGNTITFASAPPSGTNNIWVEYTSLITQVIQPSAGTVGTLQLQSNLTLSGTTTTNTITSAASTNLLLQTNNGTTAVTIDTAQNVGVGVTPSLSSTKTIELPNGFSLTKGDITYGGYLAGNCYWNGSNWIYITSHYATTYSQAEGNGSHSWQIAPSGTAGTSITFTQAMTLDNSGNLFVGSTSDPASGKFAIRAANNINLSMGASTGSISGALCFNFINNTNGANVPFEIRCLPGNFYITNGLNSGSGSTMVFNTSTGLVSYSTSSLRYKENVQDIKYGLADVLKMRAVNFDHISDKVADIGVIAEEMINVIPEVVGKNKDGLADYVNYDKLTAVLIKSIQELSAKVTALEAKVA